MLVIVFVDTPSFIVELGRAKTVISWLLAMNIVQICVVMAH